MTLEYLSKADDRPSHGEVGTPVDLINEMLDKIPEEVFRSSITTFLDPCFGSGTFIDAIIKKLRQYGHSMENIQERIYGCEVSHRLHNKFTEELSINYNFTKLYKEDFLTKDFNNMKFDVIIGNPPYQDSNSSSESIKLWSLFSEVSISNWLKDGGYICFVTPQHLTSFSRATIKQTKPVHRLQHLLEKYKFEYCDYTSDRYFNVGTSICSWMLKKVDSENNNTEFIFDDKSISAKYVANTNVNPTLVDSIIDKVFYNETHKKHHRYRHLFTKIELSETKTSEFSNPIIWNSKKADTMYSREKLDDSCKLAIHNFKPFRISEHNLLITNKDLSHSYFYLKGTEEELKGYQKQFNELKLFKFLSENFKNSKGVYLIAQLQEIIPILDPTVNWTDKGVYKEFNLTQEEINLIESTVG